MAFSERLKWGKSSDGVYLFGTEQYETTITITTTITGTAGIDVPGDGCDGGDGACLLLWSPQAYMPQVKGVLLSENPMRGATAHSSPTVRVQTKVCRGCGLHLGCQRGEFNSHPLPELAAKVGIGNFADPNSAQ
jgi:hypothetical protein